MMLDKALLLRCVSFALISTCISSSSSTSSTSSPLTSIHVDSGHFVDEFGRIRLFHGINSVIKGFPWFDPKMRSPERHQQMADWGFTAVRLGAMWTGFEPEEEGHFNETYVEILQEIVESLGK